MFLRQAVAVEELLLNYMIKVVESECWGERRKLLSEAGIETSAATNPGERKRKETDREREKWKRHL